MGIGFNLMTRMKNWALVHTQILDEDFTACVIAFSLWIPLLSFYMCFHVFVLITLRFKFV